MTASPGAPGRLVALTAGRVAHISAPSPLLWGLLLGCLGAGMIVSAVLAWRHGRSLISPWLPEQLVLHKVAVLRRGAATFMVIGVAFVVLAVLSAFTG